NNGAILREPRRKPRERQGISFSAQVIARVLQRSTRPPECFLAGLEIFWQSGWGNSRHNNRPTGNATTAVNYIEPESIGKAVGFCFVHLDQNIFLVLCGDFAPRVHFSPVENSRV